MRKQQHSTRIFFANVLPKGELHLLSSAWVESKNPIDLAKELNFKKSFLAAKFCLSAIFPIFLLCPSPFCSAKSDWNVNSQNVIEPQSAFASGNNNLLLHFLHPHIIYFHQLITIFHVLLHELLDISQNANASALLVGRLLGWWCQRPN